MWFFFLLETVIVCVENEKWGDVEQLRACCKWSACVDSPSLRDREEKLYHFEKQLAELDAKFLM